MRMLGLWMALAVGAGAAHAAPVTLTHSVRVLDVHGAPVVGATPVVVTLWSDATSTATNHRLWMATLTPSLESGYATLVLSNDGSGNLVQDTWFGSPVWIEVTVDGTLVAPRSRLGEVPRAAAVSSTQGMRWTAPGAVFALNEFPTTMQATAETYTGDINYGGYSGRLATTARCQALMGDGARLCRTEDLERFIASGAINRYGESNPAKITIPSAQEYWISSGDTDLYYNGTTSTHKYADCENFESAGTNRRGTVLYGADVNITSHGIYTEVCNGSYKLMCCR